jgi:hypothetical protein
MVMRVEKSHAVYGLFRRAEVLHDHRDLVSLLGEGDHLRLDADAHIERCA